MRSVFLYSYWPWKILFIIYEGWMIFYFYFVCRSYLTLLILLCYFQIHTYFSIWNNSILMLTYVYSNIFKVYIIKEWMQVKKDLCLRNHNFVKITIPVFISTVKMVFRIMYDSSYLSYVLNCDYYFLIMKVTVLKIFE